MDTFLNILVPIAVIATAIAGTGCVVVYHIRSRGMWQKSAFGWHLMSFMAGLVLVLYLAVMGTLAANEQWWLDIRMYVRAGVWVFLAFLFSWRFYVFVSADKMLLPARREDVDSE